MKYRILTGAAALLSVTLSSGCSDSSPSSPPPHFVVDGRIPVYAQGGPGAKSVLPAGKGLDIATDPSPPARTRNRIEYHAGAPVMRGIQYVYFIWYGSWPSSDPAKVDYQHILVDLASNLCRRPYTDVLQAYTGWDGQAPQGCLAYGGAAVDEYSHGPTLSDADVADIVLHQVATGQLPYNSEQIFYVVVGSPEIAESSGYGTNYCGWHGRVDWNYISLRFAFLGSPARNPGPCAPNGVGPNGNAAADAAASHLAALWANMATDPNYDAWFDKLGLEMADKCVWTYGTTYTAPNGKQANVHLGSRDYLLQQLWVPSKSGGACGLHP